MRGPESENALAIIRITAHRAGDLCVGYSVDRIVSTWSDWALSPVADSPRAAIHELRCANPLHSSSERFWVSGKTSARLAVPAYSGSDMGSDSET